MKTRTLARCLLTVCLLTATAQARVLDQAGMFSAQTITQLDDRISAINRQVHKDVVIVTIPSLQGQSVQEAARPYASGVNGLLILISRDDHRLQIFTGPYTGQLFTPERLAAIRDTILTSFRNNQMDQGILAGVDQIQAIFQQASTGGGRTATSPPVGISWWWIIIGFGIVFLILRALRGGGGYGAPYGGYGTAGYGYGGGGGLMQSLLGGLGGSLAGNWLYNRFNQGGSENPVINPATPGWEQPDPGVDVSSGAGGSWGSDVGAAGDSGGSWGSSGDWGGDGGSSGGSW